MPNSVRAETSLHAPHSDLVDADLVSLVGSNSHSAFSELWRRHYPSVVAEMRRTTSFDPHELAQEAFARVYIAITSGTQVAAFRAYVGRTAKNLAIDWSRKWSYSRTDTVPVHTLESLMTPAADQTELFSEKALAAAAYQELPDRYRQILWLKDAEDLPLQRCADQLGLSPEGTTTLLRRAREQFKQSWISAQLYRPAEADVECRQVSRRLPKYSRGKLTSAHMEEVRLHLDECASCDELSRQALSLAGKLSILLLICFGAGSTSSFLNGRKASGPAQGSRTPPLALMRMRPVKLIVGAALALSLTAWALAAQSLEHTPSHSDLPAVPPNTATFTTDPMWTSPHVELLVNITGVLAEDEPPAVALAQMPPEISDPPPTATLPDTSPPPVIAPDPPPPVDPSPCVNASFQASRSVASAPVISGSATPAGTVQAWFKDGVTGDRTLAGSITVAADGEWEITIDGSLSAGVIELIHETAATAECASAVINAHISWA